MFTVVSFKCDNTPVIYFITHIHAVKAKSKKFQCLSKRATCIIQNSFCCQEELFCHTIVLKKYQDPTVIS